MQPCNVKVETSRGFVTVIDHNDKSHRQWLGRMTFWAFRNKVTVTTTPTTEPVTFVPKEERDDDRDH